MHALVSDETQTPGGEQGGRADIEGRQRNDPSAFVRSRAPRGSPGSPGAPGSFLRIA